jgi:L-glutamine-phosphate cytidylyltransferase
MQAPTLIILAAGQGTRLRPLTEKCPKCMVETGGKSLIQWQVETAREAGIENIVIVGGYLIEMIDIPNVKIIKNPKFDKTNMVVSLFCAKDYFSDSMIISYGDILFEKHIIEKAISCDAPVGVIIDTEWKQYWETRFSDPLTDAETLKLDSTGDNIIEIGKSPTSFQEIQAQYIGVTKFNSVGIDALKAIYSQEEDAFKKGEKLICKERNLSELYMTDIIQGLINAGKDVKAIPINGSWLEVDNLKDLGIADQYVDNSSCLKIDRT